MGYLVNNTCYPTQADANDAWFSQIPMAITAGNPMHEVQYFKAGQWYVWQKGINADGSFAYNRTASALVFTWPPCDESQKFFDGMQMGWGVVLAMAVAWGIVVLRRGL